ncbi:MAG: S-layer protein domain-containing protein [Candidatus Methanoperedens sp.]
MSKKILGVALAVLMLLAVALPASAAIQATSVEIRGAVISNAGTTTDGNPHVWDASNFAGFWYDLKDNLKTENLAVLSVTSRSISGTSGSEQLIYNTTKTSKTLKVVANAKANGTDTDFNKFGDGTNGKYDILGWQAQPYIAVKGNAKKLAKLVIEQGNSTSEKKSLTIGETWDIGDGWTLSAQSIDAKATPRQAWLVLSKDGVKKDDKVIEQGKGYVYIEKSFAGESDVPLFVTYVDSVFAGATSDMVQLRYTWAIGTSVTEVKSGDVFGNLEVTTANSTTIELKNKDKSMDLTQDATVDIMGDMKFKVADSSTDLRYYPMVVYQISGGVTPAGETPGATPAAGTPGVTPKGTPGVKPTNATATAVATTAAPAVTETAAKTPVATATPKEPGFEAVFAIAGLLAVAYLVLRQRK